MIQRGEVVATMPPMSDEGSEWMILNDSIWNVIATRMNSQTKNPPRDPQDHEGEKNTSG